VRTLAVVLSLAALAPLTGCINEDVRSSLVLEADGGATWIYETRDVRSDAEDPAARADEEAGWLADVRSAGHPAVRVFRALGARSVRQDLVRSEPPVAVRVEARFDSVEDVGAGLADLTAGAFECVLERQGTVVRWSLRLRVDDLPDDSSAVDDEDLAATAGALEDLEVVLASGRFVETVGFETSSDGRLARFQEPTPPDDGVVQLVLAWDPTL